MRQAAKGTGRRVKKWGATRITTWISTSIAWGNHLTTHDEHYMHGWPQSWACMVASTKLHLSKPPATRRICSGMETLIFMAGSLLYNMIATDDLDHHEFWAPSVLDNFSPIDTGYLNLALTLYKSHMCTGNFTLRYELPYQLAQVECQVNKIVVHLRFHMLKIWQLPV